MDSFNQIFFNLETSLTKEEYAEGPRQMQEEKTKNISLIYKGNLFCELHSCVLEQDEFEDTLSLFSQNEVIIPNNTNPEVINVLVNYFYYREIKNLKFSLIFDLLSLSIFFLLKTLIQKILDFLKSNIFNMNGAVFVARNIFPMIFFETPNFECNFRVLFDECEKFLLKDNFLEEFFNIIKSDIFNCKINVEAEFVQHIKLLKECGVDDVHVFKLMNIFKEKLMIFKGEREKNFDCSKYFEQIIESHIDINKVDQKILNENMALLNLNKKEFRTKILIEKISHQESEKNSLKEEIIKLKNEYSKLKLSYIFFVVLFC